MTLTDAQVLALCECQAPVRYTPMPAPKSITYTIGNVLNQVFVAIGQSLSAIDRTNLDTVIIRAHCSIESDLSSVLERIK